MLTNADHLKKTQRLLQQAIATGQSVDLPDAVGNSGMFFAEAVGVYRANRRSQRVRALGENFPVCRRILGEDCFQAVAHHYIASHDCENLWYEGQFLAEFLASIQEFTPIGYLVDVAKFEWAWLNVDLTKHQKSPVIQVRHPSHMIHVTWQNHVTLMESYHPLKKIWQLNQPMITDVPNYHYDIKERYFAIWKRRGYAHSCAISENHWAWLALFGQDMSLEQLTDVWIAKGVSMPLERVFTWLLAKDCIKITIKE